MTDTEAAVERAWRELADSCVEHDQAHEARALEELRRLIPEQRTP